MSIDLPKDSPGSSRFWDRYSSDPLKTVSGFRALFKPTVGGSATAWQNSQAKISAVITGKDGRDYIRDIGVFVIEGVDTSRNEGTAVLRLGALSKPLLKANASKVKNGGEWWQNTPLSFLFNQLLESTYRDSQGLIPEGFKITRDVLGTKNQDGALSFWNLGVPPNWDGSTFNPSPTAYPVTAMCPSADGSKVYVGLGGLTGTDSAELWAYDPSEDLWTFLGKTQLTHQPIQSLVFNTRDNKIYGAIWQDLAQDSASVEQNKDTWFAPDAKMFWWDPEFEDATSYLDDVNHSLDVDKLFPGQWDIREMFPMTMETSLGLDTQVGTGRDKPFNNLVTTKPDFRASVGNYLAFHALQLPVPGWFGMSGAPTVAEQDYAFEDDPYMLHYFGKGELVPGTVSGVTSWAGASGATPPTGFSSLTDSGANFSVSAGKLTMGGVNPGLSLQIDDVPNDGTVYRLRVTGLAGVAGTKSTISARALVSGVDTGFGQRMRYIQNTDGSGDYFFFIAAGSSPTVSLVIDIKVTDGESSSVEITNLSLTRAPYYDRSQLLTVQAGENIPVTGYGKVVAAVYSKRSTHFGDEGPGFNFNDSTSGEPTSSSPIRITSTIKSIDFINSEIGWACTDNGGLFKTINGANTWARLESGTSQNLNCIKFVSSSVGFVVGDKGTLLRTTDGGQTWTFILAEFEDKSLVEVGVDINHIFMLNSEIGWFVTNSIGNGQTGPSLVGKTTDGGSTWQVYRSGSQRPINWSYFTSPQRGYINTVAPGLAQGTTVSAVSYSIDGGLSFPNSNRIKLSINRLFDVWHGVFVNDSTGYVVGSGSSIYRTTNSGASWSSLLISVDDDTFRHINFATTTLGYAVGDDGLIFKTTDGTNFTRITAPTDKDLYSVRVFADDTVIIAGQDGLVIVSTDGGVTWVEPQSLFSNEELFIEMNMIAQNRQYSGLAEHAHNPLYGPSHAERGVSPDNSKRIKIGILDQAQASTNNAVVLDVAPAFDVSSPQYPPNWTAIQNLNSEKADFETLRAGNGYMSVHAAVLGRRGLISNEDITPVQGLVRFTNHQQGLFTLAQDADQGNGVIIFAVSVSDSPIASEKFKWGPGNPGDTDYRFKVALKAFKCSTKEIIDIGINPWTTDEGPNGVSPFNEVNSTLYPTAGCSTGSKVYVASQVANLYSPLYDGSNELDVVSPGHIWEIDLGVNAFSGVGVSIVKKYSSPLDQSIYPLSGGIQGGVDTQFRGVVNNAYARVDSNDPAGPVNKTRKICWLHYNPAFPNQVMGWAFRKDSLLTDPDAEVTVPCHEVFLWDPTVLVSGGYNQLTIIDHDTQDGVNTDSVGFMGFASDTDKTWYFRIKKPTLYPSRYYGLGESIGLSYVKKDFWEGSTEQLLSAGYHWDGAATATLSGKLYGGEGFISNRQAVVAKDPVSGRSQIISGFDSYMGVNSLSLTGYQSAASGPSKIWFKIDSEGLDPRIELADFSDLKSWDAISQLCLAHNLVFGFDNENLFILPRSNFETVNTFSAVAGDIIDLVKRADSDIRNLVTVIPYRPQLQEANWEVTHVAGRNADGTLFEEDPTLFSGEFFINVKRPIEASLNFICTRKGRLLNGRNTLGQYIEGDATHDFWDKEHRSPVLFKFLTHNPTVDVTLMRTALQGTKEILLNTTYPFSGYSIEPGDIMTFTNEDTFQQYGLVIESINRVQNLVTLEQELPFTVQEFTPITVVRANLGASLNPLSQGGLLDSWSKRYSDEGVGVIRSIRYGTLTSTDSMLLTRIASQFINGTMVYQVTSDKPHNLSVGDKFTLSKPGILDFQFNGQYQVLSVQSVNRVTALILKSEKPRGVWDVNITPDQVFMQVPNSPGEVPHTIIKLNNISAFRGVSIKPYGEGYKHFSFVLTTLPSDSVATIDLPEMIDRGDFINTTPLSYVYAVNAETMEVDIGPGVQAGFSVGDVVNLHYCITPTASVINTNPPFLGLSQDLPNGLGSWHWIADPDKDTFNPGDYLRIKFEGIKLVKDESSAYKGVNPKSIRLWGESEWTMPENRFISHDSAQYWAREFLVEYGDPKLEIVVTVKYMPDASFLSPDKNSLRAIRIIDPVMFPGMSGFKVSGLIRSIEEDLKGAKTTLTIRSKEVY